MKIYSDSIQHGMMIPEHFALGTYDRKTHVTFADNVNPHIAWKDAPDGTKSFALMCIDKTVPTRPDDVNQEGRLVPADLSRADFFHWLLANIPASLCEIGEGEVCRGVTAKGKPSGDTQYGVAGINDYTGWFKGDVDMEGFWGGYDGPCPPWNDSLIHEYQFIVYALDVETLDLPERYTGADLRNAIKGHILDQDTITGYYTINPTAK